MSHGKKPLLDNAISVKLCAFVSVLAFYLHLDLDCGCFRRYSEGYQAKDGTLGMRGHIYMQERGRWCRKCDHVIIPCACYNSPRGLLSVGAVKLYLDIKGD